MEGIQFQLNAEQEAAIEQELQRLLAQAINRFSSQYERHHPYMKKCELIQYLHLSNNSVDHLIKAGLPQLRIQGTVLYSKKQVDEWLEGHKSQR